MIISVTFYNFSKLKTFCGPKDVRISFSKNYSVINFLVSTLCYAGVVFWLLELNRYSIIRELIFFVCVPLYILGALFTALLVWFDKIFCYCCGCFIGVGEIVVFDPSNPGANLVWRDGQVSNFKYI